MKRKLQVLSRRARQSSDFQDPESNNEDDASETSEEENCQRRRRHSRVVSCTESSASEESEDEDPDEFDGKVISLSVERSIDSIIKKFTLLKDELKQHTEKYHQLTNPFRKLYIEKEELSLGLIDMFDLLEKLSSLKIMFYEEISNRFQDNTVSEIVVNGPLRGAHHENQVMKDIENLKELNKKIELRKLNTNERFSSIKHSHVKELNSSQLIEFHSRIESIRTQVEQQFISLFEEKMKSRASSTSNSSQ